MQTEKILQAVLLMFILAAAASCATSNQYVSKIFKPRNMPEPVLAKKEIKAPRFLDFDSTDELPDIWVKKDMKEDTATISGDVAVVIKDDAKVDSSVAEKTTPIIVDPVAKTGNPDGTRTKKTREK